MIGITVRGDCEWTVERLRRSIAANAPQEILDARGQFVVVSEEPDRTTIVTSRGGVQLHFYARTRSGVVHGGTVGEVHARSGLPWRWNHQALGDYLALGHVLGDDTVVAGVRRTPPGSVTTIESGEVTLVRDRRRRIADAFSVTALRDALETEVMRSWRGGGDVLCLTGGLDSRLLLSVLLRNGVRPRVLVCGQPRSDDVLIAREIAARFALDLVECQVTATDFLLEADRIAQRTNGVLPVSHWPGVLFARYAEGARLFLGFNGEAARTTYDEIARHRLIRRLMPPDGRFARRKWRLRHDLALTERESEAFHPELREGLAEAACGDRLERLLRVGGGLGAALDHAFATERTPNKTGADLAAVSGFTEWAVPFCTDAWSTLARAVPWYRRGSGSIHRRLIRRLEPALLRFPTEGRGRRRRPWASAIHQVEPPRRHFFDQLEYQDARLVAYMRAEAGRLDDLVDWSAIESSGPELRSRLLFSLASVGALRRLTKGLPR
ncbi:asparagine synthase-related protein [Streptomyces sp. NPDC059015]|uniref:asparagine synthase-related protein n=1 Tax=unclassified Streptomyces TaxID=2593676 RepID=UPI0036AAB44F